MQTIHNFRDFGGYKTSHGRLMKKGLLYRSGSLAKMSAADLEKLLSLGIRTICDLRTSKEKADHPDRIPNNLPIKFIHLPMKAKKHDESAFISQLSSFLFGEGRRLKFDDVLKEFYQEYVTDFRPELSEIIRLTAEATNLPILIHCTAGKDRTGVACSLIQLSVGMPLERVIQDYLLTNDHLSVFRAETLKRFRIFSILGLSRQKFLPLFEARREYLEAAFAQIRRDYGSVEDYVRDGLGCSAETRLRLNQLLLE